MSAMSTILALLALAGGAFSYYFLQVHRLKLSPDVWWIPPVCRVGKDTCQTLVDTSYGKTFGRPNAFWGSLSYPVVLVGVVMTDLMELGPTLLVAFSVAMASVSVYLSWGLVRLKTVCRVCIAVHTINFLFLVLVVIDLVS